MQTHRAICKITSGLCALICTLKPECCSGSLISIQSISLTSFFQPSSCWGDLRLDTSREMCQTRIERQLVYISQGCGNQIVRRPPRTAAWLQKAEVTVSVNDALWMIPTMFSRNSEYTVRIQRIECLFYCICYIPATIGGLKDNNLGLLLELKVLVLSKPLSKIHNLSESFYLWNQLTSLIPTKSVSIWGQTVMLA